MTLDSILDPSSPIRKITYPISIDKYRSNWGDWDIIREFLSNAVDAENGDWNSVKVSNTNGSTSIRNVRRPLSIKDFYLGYSSQGKDLSSSHIGRFNEGMKIAMIAALRSGYNVKIRFDKYMALPSAVDTEDGIKVLEVKIFETKDKMDGTEVIISGTKGNTQDLMRTHVITPNDDKILSSVYEKDFIINCGKLRGKGRALDVLNTRGIFLGGMYVSELKDHSWGYNISPSLMHISEGRDLVNVSELNKLLCEGMCFIDKTGYWEKIFSSIKDGDHPAESDINIYGSLMESSAKHAARSAWDVVFGENCVVEDELSKEVVYRGGKTVKKTNLLSTLSESYVIPSGIEFLERYSQSKRLFYHLQHLSETERKAYDIIKLMVSLYSPGTSVAVYTPIVAEKELGFFDPVKSLIGINRSCFSCPTALLDTLHEELTHAVYGTDDTSRKHADMLRKIAADFMLDDYFIKKVTELRDLYEHLPSELEVE